MAGHGRRIVETAMTGDCAADDPLKVRPGAVRAARIEGVARGADLGRALAAPRICTGEQGAEVDHRRRSGSLLGALRQSDTPRLEVADIAEQDLAVAGPGF